MEQERRGYDRRQGDRRWKSYATMLHEVTNLENPN
jgi:hypothetical protein